MRRQWPLRILTPFSLAATLFFACAPEQTAVVPAPEAEKPVAVYRSHLADLNLIPGDRKVTVQWKMVGGEVISGFDVFIIDQQEAGNPEAVSQAKPFNSAVYPGDTNPDDGVVEFPAENLVNGVKYAVWVRIVRADGTFSEPTEIKSTVCGPRGEITLGLRYRAERDGYSLVKNVASKADASDNDLYFYKKDGVNYLASPSLLNGYLRATKFKYVPYKGSDAMRDVMGGRESAPADDKVPVKAGDWVWLVTAEGFNAVLHVLEIKREEMSLYFTLCPLAGEKTF
jgi:hypothetical protein